MAVSEFLNRVSPGQLGTLSQGSGRWREIRCKSVRPDSVICSLSRETGEGQLASGTHTLFQALCEGGILRCQGSLKVTSAEEAEFWPTGEAHQVVNRREAFRVAVSLRGELAGTLRTGEENYDTQWKCALRDLSVGGAKLVLPSPAPALRSQALLRVDLPTEEKPVILPCIVIESSPKKNVPPMDAFVRVSFHAVTSRLENQLSRYINWVQIDMMKKGIR